MREYINTMRRHVRGIGTTYSGNGLRFTTLNEVKEGRWTGFRGFVLADEIYGENLEIVKRRMFPNPLLAAYYTLPEHG
jgi:hypothetical protein